MERYENYFTSSPRFNYFPQHVMILITDILCNIYLITTSGLKIHVHPCPSIQTNLIRSMSNFKNVFYIGLTDSFNTIEII